jgi:hypothetical protein
MSNPKGPFGCYLIENKFWVKILKFFDADPDPGICLILDGKTSDPQSWINIPDLQHWLWRILRSVTKAVPVFYFAYFSP